MRPVREREVTCQTPLSGKDRTRDRGHNEKLSLSVRPPNGVVPLAVAVVIARCRHIGWSHAPRIDDVRGVDTTFERPLPRSADVSDYARVGFSVAIIIAGCNQVGGGSEIDIDGPAPSREQHSEASCTSAGIVEHCRIISAVAIVIAARPRTGRTESDGGEVRKEIRTVMPTRGSVAVLSDDREIRFTIPVVVAGRRIIRQNPELVRPKNVIGA